MVMLTTSREERDMIASYEAGANSFIRKPLSYAEFLDAAREIGRYWLELNEAPATPAI